MNYVLNKIISNSIIVRKVVSKLLERTIRKKAGYHTTIKLEKLELSSREDSNPSVVLDISGRIECSSTEFNKILSDLRLL